MNNKILSNNKEYWNETADNWFGVTALPVYGPLTATEDELKLFGDVSGKKMLEICCGSGHSLVYHAQKHAGELWGLDISESQLYNARRVLDESGYSAKLICAPMEAEANIPTNYFDYVYSIFGIGWTTDLAGTFKRINSYLKDNGIFIFSWTHPIRNCIELKDDKFIFNKSYFDDEWYKQTVYDSDMLLANRKISTYINALYESGFIIEKMVEKTDEKYMNLTGDLDERTRRAQMCPSTFIFKVHKQV